MNAKTRSKLSEKLSKIFEIDSPYNELMRKLDITQKESKYAIVDRRNIRELLRHLDSESIDFEKIWKEINRNLAVARRDSAKNARFAQALLADARFRFDEIRQNENHKYARDDENELRSILDSIDEAIINIDDTSQFPQIFSFRNSILRYINLRGKNCLKLSLETNAKFDEGKKEELSKNKQLIDSMINGGRKHTQKQKDDRNNLSDKFRPFRIENHSEKGRQILATKDLSIFDFQNRNKHCTSSANDSDTRDFTLSSTPSVNVIHVERPYLFTFPLSEFRKRCFYCARKIEIRNEIRFKPCQACIDVIYCDSNCQRQDWFRSHRHECGSISAICREVDPNFDFDFTESDDQHKSRDNFRFLSFAIFRLCSRVGIQAILRMHASDDEDKSNNNDKCSNMFEKKQFQAFVSLRDHADRFRFQDVGRYLLESIDCAICAGITQGYEFNLLGKQNFFTLIANIYSSIARVHTNAFVWNANSSQTQNSTGSWAVYLLGSMFNHSCEPTINWQIDPRDATLKLSPNLPLKCGEELTINYASGVNFANFNDRHRFLAKAFYFDCNCSKCLRDIRKSSQATLRCHACAGPVMISSSRSRNSSQNFDDKDNFRNLQFRCLRCFEPMLGAKLSLDKLEAARRDLRLIAHWFTEIEMTPSVSLSTLSAPSNASKSHKFATKIMSLLDEIFALSYHKSLPLIEDIFFACQALHRISCSHFFANIIRWGKWIDRSIVVSDEEEEEEEEGVDNLDLLPLFLISSISSSSLPDIFDLEPLFDRNIDHMLFWSDKIFRPYLGIDPNFTQPNENIENTSFNATCADPKSIIIFETTNNTTVPRNISSSSTTLANSCNYEDDNDKKSTWKVMLRFAARTIAVIRRTIETLKQESSSKKEMKKFETRIAVNEQIELLKILLARECDKLQRDKVRFEQKFSTYSSPVID